MNVVMTASAVQSGLIEEDQEGRGEGGQGAPAETALESVA